MRVISGTAKGRKLFSLEGLDTRPTADKVKGAIFNILYPYLQGARVLDLFAGSGALGIEALSRGADSVVFCDNNIKAINIIKKNAEITKVSDKCKFNLIDSVAYLNSCTEQFDIILIDPPYASGLYSEVLLLIKEKNILSDGGIIITERRSNTEPPLYNGTAPVSDRKYGNSTISIFKE